MSLKVFYSWQSDTRAAANRSLIEEALQAAVRAIRHDGSIGVDVVVDRDTKAVAGAPDIGETILEKIDASAAVVADVTIVGANRPGWRSVVRWLLDDQQYRAPNPNVLVEVGYALKALGESRLILVQNTAFGGPELLPFDLRQKRVLTYISPEHTESRANDRRNLQESLQRALALVFTQLGAKPTTEYAADLGISHEERGSSGEDYKLTVTLTNRSTKPIKEWHVDVEVPTWLLDPTTTQMLLVREQSDSRRTVLRATQDSHGGPIYPNDRKVVMIVDYRVKDLAVETEPTLLDHTVRGTAYVHGEISASVEKPVRELYKPVHY